MLKTMREGGAHFIKGVMLVLVVAFIGTIFISMVLPIFTLQDYIK